VSSLPAIIAYVSQLAAKANLADDTLSPSLKAQKLAWSCHIENHFGDLVVGLFLSFLLHSLIFCTGIHVLRTTRELEPNDAWHFS
jgi:hypothetical protein